MPTVVAWTLTAAATWALLATAAGITLGRMIRAAEEGLNLP